LPLSRKDTKSLVITADIVFIPPPPIPAMALETTKAHKLFEAPHIADPIKNTTVANNNADLRPKASEIRPSIIYQVIMVIEGNKKVKG
jgi:hypothetical protein